MTQWGTGLGGPPPPPAEPGEPPPPRGPGVVAPFPAPPRERNPRLWIGLGVAALVLVLCVGGGVAGFLAYGLSVSNKVTATVRDYLGALRAERYDDAYRMQCAVARQQQSRSEFTAQFREGPRLSGYQLSQPEAADVGGGSAYAVPAHLTFDDGSESRKKFVVVTDSQGGFAVCGVLR